MPPKPTQHIRTHRGENARIGPVSLITLIIVVCMAVMGVLAASTAHATATISSRQAEATKYLYATELAGQEFIASVDDVLAGVRASGGGATEGARAVERELDSICANARAATEQKIDCTAAVDGTTVTADFVCEDARLLSVAVTIQGNATYRVAQWKMTSAQQEPQTGGTLWKGE